MTTIRDQDDEEIDFILDIINNPDVSNNRLGDIEDRLTSSVHLTHFDYSEMGATVATTNVIDYNMPISWGFTPKLIQYHASHIAQKIRDYDVNNPPIDQPSNSNLEWNVDVGLAILFTDDFMREEFGLDGAWLEGEWVFGISGMNMFPTDITTYGPQRFNPEFPTGKPSMQTLYQIGLAHYREKSR